MSIIVNRFLIFNFLPLLDDFTSFIDEHKPVVFTKENIEPYACGHQAGRCEAKVSEVYEIAGVSMDINGPACETFSQCNDPTFGPLPEYLGNPWHDS